MTFETPEGSYAIDPHGATGPDADLHGDVVLPYDPRTPVPMTGHLGTVALMEGGHTFYARFGDLFGWLFAIATVLLWIGWPLLDRYRKKKGSQGAG